jgi:uncharacterized protein (DUF488 family)
MVSGMIAKARKIHEMQNMVKTSSETQAEVHTIGHSNHDLDRFIGLLKQHRIDLVVDTRSSPYSRFSPQFNREVLRASLLARNIGYHFMGESLGGRPNAEEFYDAEGHALYWRIAQTEDFSRAIDQIIAESNSHRIALLCSEEDPRDCHRRLLVGRVLGERGVRVQHIRGDGAIQTEEEVARCLMSSEPLLFTVDEVREWKSIRSVLDRKPQNSFSER